MSELLEYASEYGFSIIPCGPDKKPLVPWKEFSERRATEEEITRWCRELQPACWAVVCGEISGIIVLDFDGEPGLQTLKRLNLRPHVQTPSGGCHLYVRHPGRHVPTVCGKSKKGFAELYPACDIRADGGYVLFCGSTPKGNYRVLRPLTEPEPWESLPPDLRLLAIGIDPRYVKIFRRYIEEASVGCRNQTGFELAVQLRDNGCPKETAEEIMRVYAESVPQAPGERYTVAEALASLKQAYLRPPREPWGVATERHEEKRGEVELDIRPMSSLAEFNTKWLIPGILARGAITLLAGSPGSGKTTFSASIVYSLATGTPFWNKPVERCKILWLLLDDSPQRVKSELIEEYYGGCPDTIFVPSNPVPLSATGVDVYAETIRSHGFDLLVVDTCLDFLSVSDFDKTREMQTAMSLFRQLADKSGAAILAITHLSKNVLVNDLNRIAGSHQLTAKSDIVLLLWSDNTNPQLGKLKCEKCRLGPQGWAVTFEKRQGLFIPIEDGRTLTSDEKILGLFLNADAISRQDIIRTLEHDMTARTIERRLRKLTEERLLTKERQSGTNITIYRLTSAGKAKLFTADYSDVYKPPLSVLSVCAQKGVGNPVGKVSELSVSLSVSDNTDNTDNTDTPFVLSERCRKGVENPNLESNTLNPADENGTNSKDDKDEHETVSIDNDYDYFLDEDEHDTNSADDEYNFLDENDTGSIDDEYNFLDEDDVKPAPLADNESDDLPFGIDAGPPENEVPELEAVFADVPSSYDPYSQPWDGDESGFYDPLRPRAYCLQCGLPVALRVMNDDICASLEGWRYYVCARCGHLKALRYPRLAEMQSYRVLFSQNIAHGG